MLNLLIMKAKIWEEELKFGKSSVEPGAWCRQAVTLGGLLLVVLSGC